MRRYAVGMRRAIVGAGVAAALAGCVSPANDRMTIGQTVRVSSSITLPPAPAEGTGAQVQTPSVTGIDRSHWAPTLFLVPVDGTVHHPTYAKHFIVADNTARQRREYPTVLNALELWGGSEEGQEWEALLNHMRGVWDLVVLPINVIVQRPWIRRMSPQIAYERYPHPERPQPEPVEPPADPFAPPRPQRVTP